MANKNTTRARARSPHPGVKLKPPSEAQRKLYWRAVYTDPDTGKVVYERLDPLVITSKPLAVDWAKRKARDIAKRAAALEDGAARLTGLTLPQGVELFYKHNAQLRARTAKDYRTSTDLLVLWAEQERLTCDTLTRARLAEYPSWLLTRPKRVKAAKAKRGATKQAAVQRRRVTVNGDIRVARRVLGWLRLTDRLPKITMEEMQQALKKFDEEQKLPVFLKPLELRELLEAALRHDADVHTMTREERWAYGEGKDRIGGSTPKYAPIAPLVLTAMLTGMRLAELCRLQWSDVDLDALDHEGKAVGEVRTTAELNKTRRSRLIFLSVSPALRQLLLALHRKRGSDADGPVFDEISYEGAENAMDRLRDTYGAPKRFTYQVLRSSCATYLSNAASIFGAAAPFHSAKQLGHSVAVAEKHYAGQFHGIPKAATTIEAAMQVEAEARSVVRHVTDPTGKQKVVALHGVR